MINNLKIKLDKICDIPRPTRGEVREILKEIYTQGKKDGYEKWVRDRKLIRS